MKRLSLLLPAFATLVLTSCEGMFPFNDDITKKSVYGEWHPVSYEENGVTTEPTVEQRNDFIRFNEDKTYVTRQKDNVEEGEWYFNGINNSINVMTDEDPNNCIPYIVESVNEEEMVYKMPSQNGVGNVRVTLVR
jgi:hypothetical protein